MFHPFILVLTGRIPLWLSATNRIHMKANLLVHVNVAAMQKPQMLSILRVSLTLVTQHAKCMHPIILSSVAFLALHFPTLSHNTIFLKTLLNIKCVF